ncbi:hypothetical protein [Ruminococcus sp.]|uniref:hypothetical protein n=1 Tax=Ruminococcus sp. TaxID=41978 RepID=UPI002C13E32B|nr:hypothetical protein [Ruminococcus sp.]HNZ99881.1 hypothetical protein [Ruminococcus sp.]HOH87440.1 hypothetical protein [Ruminococcus sp.]
MKKGTTHGIHTFLKVLAGTMAAGLVLFSGAVALRLYRVNYRITLSDEDLAHIEQVFDISEADEFRYFSYSGRDSEKGETVELETDDYERFISGNVNASLEFRPTNDGRLLYDYSDGRGEIEVISLAGGSYCIKLHETV